MLSAKDKLDFQWSLLVWSERAGRHFPWRSQCDPYATLMAEKLLQQTASRNVVIQAYNQLLQSYPTPGRLADAAIPDLERIILPLGLLYRAKELRAMAEELVARCNGEVPETLEELLSLPGVGDYVARAVLSFAFGKDVPVVDTNVARFLYRLYGIPGRLPTNPSRNKGLISMAAELIPSGRSRQFNYAILDLCALICRPSNPDCPVCPVSKHCEHGKKGESTDGN